MGGERPGAQRPRPEVLRLFVAVLLPEAWLDALSSAQGQLRDAGLPLRFVRPEGIHLTLKFLGETPSDRLPAIESALGEAAARSSPCVLELGAGGIFGSRRRPRVVWQAVAGDLAGLSALHRNVDDALHRAGFPRETREFNPHLTLARVPEQIAAADVERIAPAAEALRPGAVAPLHARSIALMRSELDRGGARYTALRRWELSRQSDA